LFEIIGTKKFFEININFKFQKKILKFQN
jgi:hypothetical protein